MKETILYQPCKVQAILSDISQHLYWYGEAPQPHSTIQVELDLSCHSDLLIEAVKRLIDDYQLTLKLVYHKHGEVALLNAQLSAWQQKHGLENCSVEIIENVDNDAYPPIIARIISREAFREITQDENQCYLLLVY